MVPIWHNYYKDCDALIFMVDLSNTIQVLAACIQLLDVLTHQRLQNTPVLLIYNKTDLSSTLSRTEWEELVCLWETLDHAHQKVAIIEARAREGQGLADIAKWIQQHGKPNTTT